MRALRGSKIRGVWPAIVIDSKDGAGNPGYRAKLKFPWLSEQDTTFWARIAVPMAGPERGTYVLPEVDDVVVVAADGVRRPHRGVDPDAALGEGLTRDEAELDLARDLEVALHA